MKPWICLFLAGLISPVSFAEESSDSVVISAADRLIAERENAALIADLSDVLARRNAFFDEADSLPENERARRASDIADRFETLSRRNPDSVPVLYFYAEFLRDGGELKTAEEMLLKAEKLEPTFAPLQFLLAEILQEKGEPENAFPRFEKAVYEDPGNAEYQCAFGEFLADSRERLVEQKILSRSELDAKMQNAFLAASAAEPGQADFLWRYAESFYDVENPDWNRALSVWERVARRLNKKEHADLLPVASLHRARVLAELGRIEEADTLLRKTAGNPALERSRKTVYEIIKKQKK